MQKQLADAVSVKPIDVTLTVTAASMDSVSEASTPNNKRAQTLLATTAGGVNLDFAVAAKDQSAVDSIKILAADALKDPTGASTLLHVTATSAATISVKSVPLAHFETTSHFGIDKYMTWERAGVSNNTKCEAALWEEEITTYEAAAKCEADPDVCKGVVFKYDEDPAKWDFVMGSPFMIFLKARFMGCGGNAVTEDATGRQLIKFPKGGKLALGTSLVYLPPSCGGLTRSRPTTPVVSLIANHSANANATHAIANASGNANVLSLVTNAEDNATESSGSASGNATESSSGFDMNVYEGWKRANPVNNTNCSTTTFSGLMTTYEAARKCEESEDCTGVMFKHDDDRGNWDVVIGSPFLAFLRATFVGCSGTVDVPAAGWLTVVKPPKSLPSAPVR